LEPSTTEILDVAPVDIFEALNKRIVAQIPDFILSSEFKDQGLEFAFHWVSEKGPSSQIRLSSGLSITPTVSLLLVYRKSSFKTEPSRILLKLARRWTYV
jgi:hypothetical protein